MINFSKRIYKIFACFVITLRIVVPLFIWIDPFYVPIICQLIDGLDYSLIMNSKVLSKTAYQKLDKSLDFYYLLMMFAVSIYWGNLLLIALFIYRSIGFIIVLISEKRIFFVMFNNTFEWMYNLFSFGYVYNSNFLETLNKNVLYFLIPVFLLKMIPELYIHYFNGDFIIFKLGILKEKKK